MVAHIILGFVAGLVVAMIISYLVILRKFFVFLNKKSFQYMIEMSNIVEELNINGVDNNE